MHMTDALRKTLIFPSLLCSGAGHVEERLFMETLNIIFGVWYNEAGL